MVIELIGGRFNHLDLGIIILALLVLYPVFFAIVGWRMAFENRVKWLIPIICVVIFFISAKLVYDMNEWFYVAEYLVIAYIGMFSRILIKHQRNKKSISE